MGEKLRHSLLRLDTESQDSRKTIAGKDRAGMMVSKDERMSSQMTEFFFLAWRSEISGAKLLSAKKVRLTQHSRPIDELQRRA